MIKVIHIVQHLKLGGIEKLVLDFFKLMKDEDIIINIVSLEGTDDDVRCSWPEAEKYLKLMYFLEKSPGWDMLCFRKLIKIISQIKPNVIHTHHIGPLIYGGISAKICQIPCLIHTEHDAWHLSSKKRRFLQKSILKIAKPLVIADAKLVANNFYQAVNYQNVKIIHNAIDTAHYIPGSKTLARKYLSLPDSKCLIGSSGRLEKIKGHHHLIDAMAYLPKHICLVIAGDGSEIEKLKRQVKQNNLESRVYFLGKVIDMVSFYQSIDLFCLPSEMEGFPLAILEAQSVGIPVIATDVGAVKEGLCPETSLIAANIDGKSIAYQLNKALSLEYIDSPRDYIKRNFDLKLMLYSYKELYLNGIS